MPLGLAQPRRVRVGLTAHAVLSRQIPLGVRPLAVLRVLSALVGGHVSAQFGVHVRLPSGDVCSMWNR